MKFVIDILVAVVATLHLYFFYLEAFLWTKPAGMRIFKQTKQQAQDSATLAANQGLYNTFLAAGLIWSLFQTNPVLAHQLQIFFMGCVLVAGIFGAVTASKRILYVQALPAAVALILLLL